MDNTLFTRKEAGEQQLESILISDILNGFNFSEEQIKEVKNILRSIFESESLTPETISPLKAAIEGFNNQNNQVVPTFNLLLAQLLYAIVHFYFEDTQSLKRSFDTLEDEELLEIPFFDYFESAYTLSEEVADEALWDYINNLEGGLLNNSWIIN